MKRQTGWALLVFVLLLNGCGREKLDSRQLDWNNGLAYKHGDTAPFTGTVVFNDEIPNTVVAFWRVHGTPLTRMQPEHAFADCTVPYIKGLEDGEVRCEGLTGKQALAFTIKNETIDGEAEIDDPNSGEHLAVLNFAADVLDGRQRSWLPNGDKVTDATYANNAPVDGAVADLIGGVRHYKDGKLNGPATINGKGNSGQSQGQYVDGERDGVWEDTDFFARTTFDQIREDRPGPALPENYAYNVYTLKSTWDHGSPRGKVQGYDKKGQLILEWTMTDTGLNGDYMDIPEGASQPRKLVYKDNHIIAGMVSPTSGVATQPMVQPSAPTTKPVLGQIPPPRAPVQATMTAPAATPAPTAASLPAPTQVAGKDAHPIPLDPNQGAIDFTSGPFPISNVDRNADNLPIYEIECNKGNCVGPTGEPVGSETDVASQLPLLPKAFLNGHGYVCHEVCWDKDHNLIAANPTR